MYLCENIPNTVSIAFDKEKWTRDTHNCLGNPIDANYLCYTGMLCQIFHVQTFAAKRNEYINRKWRVISTTTFALDIISVSTAA